MAVHYSKLTPAQKRLVEHVQAKGPFSYSTWGGKVMQHLPAGASITTLECVLAGGWLTRRSTAWPMNGYQVTDNPEAPRL